MIKASQESFEKWRIVPAPKRGELIYQISLKLREHKDSLGSLISFEMGKSKSEGDEEVQETSFLVHCVMRKNMSLEISNINMFIFFSLNTQRNVSSRS